MFEYVLNRVHYDNRKKKWIDDGIIGIYDTLDEARDAYSLFEVSDNIDHPGKYQHYIEHRIKLNYAGSN